MKKATRTLTWTTSKGQATATITVTRGIETTTRKTDWDVEINEESVICATNVSVIIAGMDAVFEGRPGYDPQLPSEYAARIGRSQLAINHDVYAEMTALIDDATVEAETDQSWIDYKTAESKAAAADAKYQRHHNAVVNAMAE